MKILFNIWTTIEIHDADEFPPRDVVEQKIVELFESEGMKPHGLEVTNYGVPADE